MINDILIVTLLLSIAGGVTSIIYLAAGRYLYKFTSARFMVTLNVLVTFTFAVPVYKIIYYTDETTRLLKDYEILVLTEPGTMSHLFYTFLGKSGIVPFISNFWMVGVIAYILLTFLHYTIWIQMIRKYSKKLKDTIWVDVFQELCKRHQILASRIVLLSNPRYVQPCITGVFKKYIMIPEHLIDSLSVEEISLILRHELIHGKRNDVAYKLFMKTLNCLHWYNPLLYVLRKDLDNWIEMACDEKLCEKFSIVERQSYIYLLLKLAEEEKQQKKYALCFGVRKKKNFKRRVYAIMKPNQEKRRIAKVLILTMIFAVVTGASVVAKEADVPVYNVFSERTYVADEAEVAEIEEGMIVNDYAQYELVDNVSFVDDNQSEIEPNHMHQYIETKLSEHRVKSDNSCTMTIYYAMKCTVCGLYLKGDVYSQTTYPICPH